VGDRGRASEIKRKALKERLCTGGMKDLKRSRKRDGNLKKITGEEVSGQREKDKNLPLHY